MDICYWGTSLAVKGQICNVGQNILQSSFQAGLAISPSYFQIFFLIAFLKEAVTGNIIQ
jgi:hypothetical protein